jgi:hypothetical protein
VRDHGCDVHARPDTNYRQLLTQARAPFLVGIVFAPGISVLRQFDVQLAG